MNAPPRHNALVAILSAWWHDRRDDNPELSEIAGISEHELETVAADCGLSTHALIDVIKARPHGSDEMLELMGALNIDAAMVKASSAQWLRPARNVASSGNAGAISKPVARLTATLTIAATPMQ